MSKLVEACKDSETRLETIKTFLADPEANVNETDDLHNTALHHAAKLNRLDIVMQLLRHPKTDPNAENHYRQTALHAAAESSHIGNMQFLALAATISSHPKFSSNLKVDRRGYEVHRNNLRKYTTLSRFTQIISEFEEALKDMHLKPHLATMFSRATNLGEGIEGSPVNHACIALKDSSIAKSILDFFALPLDLPIPKSEEMTAIYNLIFHLACQMGAYYLVKTLISNPDYAINLSARYPEEIFVMTGKYCHPVNPRSPLDRTIVFKQPDVFALLLAHTATCGPEVVQRAFELAYDKDDLASFRAILARPDLKVDPNTKHYTTAGNHRSNCGLRPLLDACTNKRYLYMEALLGNPRIDPNKRITYGFSNVNRTALAIAMDARDLKAIELLLQHPNTNPEQGCKYDDYTLLHELCYKRDIAVIRLVLAHPQTMLNAIPYPDNHFHRTLTCYQETSFICAIRTKRFDIASLYLDNPRLDPNKANRRKETPLHIAIECIRQAAGDQALIIRYTHFIRKLILHEKINTNKPNTSGDTPLHCANRFNNHELLKLLYSDPRTKPWLKNSRGQTALDIWSHTLKAAGKVFSLPCTGLKFPIPEVLRLPDDALKAPLAERFSSLGAKIALGVGITSSVLLGVAVTSGLIAAAIFTGVITPILIGLVAAFFFGMVTKVGTAACEEHFNLDPDNHTELMPNSG